MQVKPELGTSQLDVGRLNVQFAVSTRVSQRPNSPLAGVWSWEQPDRGRCERHVVDVHRPVRVLTAWRPRDWRHRWVRRGRDRDVPVLDVVGLNRVAPTTVTGAGFWPSAWFPPLFVHVLAALTVAVRTCRLSTFPRPA